MLPFLHVSQQGFQDRHAANASFHELPPFSTYRPWMDAMMRRQKADHDCMVLPAEQTWLCHRNVQLEYGPMGKQVTVGPEISTLQTYTNILHMEKRSAGASLAYIGAAP